MPESDDAAEDIQAIRFQLENIEATQRLLVRDRAPSLTTAYFALFRDDESLLRVYLAVDGTRTQQEIVSHLEASGAGISQPTVSRKLTDLTREGLIEASSIRKGRALVYRKNLIMDDILQLSRRLTKGDHRKLP